jgi:large subunit ribosomal protein L15
MKLHDLRPAEGSRKERTRVGRGIAAGKGKTAGRGTKGQKARAGGGIPPWFEGGQTPLHMRIPKLRGFKNRFKTVYEVVNIGAIDAAAARGAFELPAGDAPKGKAKAKAKADAQVTINQDILRAVGLVRTLDKPLKILGNGELTVPLFVVADAFTASARTKIEAAGGTVSVLEVPTAPRKALGLEPTETGTPELVSTAGSTVAAETAPAADPDTAETTSAAIAVDEPEVADVATEATAEPDEAPVEVEASAADDTDGAPSDDTDAAASDEAETASRDDA